MPKFIGNQIFGATELEPNTEASGIERVRLTYAQTALLPADQVLYSLDTTDRGGRGQYAKRWFRWFASADAIEACPRATPKMLAAARRARKLAGCPLAETPIVPVRTWVANREVITGFRIGVSDKTYPIGSGLHIALDAAFATLANLRTST